MTKKVKTVVKNILVHTCYDIDTNRPKPLKCDCRRMISAEQADEMLRLGKASYVVGFDKAKPYEDGTQVCMKGKHKKTPRSATVDAKHIYRAYCSGDLTEQSRINRYGLMTLLARLGFRGKKIPAPLGTMEDWEHVLPDSDGELLNRYFNYEPVGGREKDYGRQ